MYLFLIIAGVFVLIAGGTNYVLVLKNRSARSMVSSKGLLVAFFVASLLTFLYNVLVNVAPEYAFLYVHYGWFYGISIAVFILSLILGVLQLFIYNKHSFERKTNLGVSQILVGICVLILMIGGGKAAASGTYELSEPRDFKLLENIPSEYDSYSYFYLKSDIDFEGQTVTEPFGRKGARYTINGRGYAIRNLNAELILTEKVSALFLNSYSVASDGYTGGIYISSQVNSVYNLKLDSCSFTLTPNGYDEDSFSSYKCDFALMKKSDAEAIAGSEITMTNTTVTVKPAIENIRSIDKTSIGEIFAELVGSDLLGLNIVREEESE